MSNKWQVVLTSLDRAIGGSDIDSSFVTIKKQGFDNDRKRFFAILSYSYTRDVTPTGGEYRPKKKQKTQKEPRAKTPSYRNRKQQNLKLLKAVNAMAKARGSSFPLT